VVFIHTLFRDEIITLAAQETEFSVLSMCSTPQGYDSRICKNLMLPDMALLQEAIQVQCSSARGEYKVYSGTINPEWKFKAYVDYVDIVKSSQ
jgi:hypothetical protein